MNRDSSVKLSYTLISDSTFAYRHALRISWAKVQEALASVPPSEVEFVYAQKQQSFSMLSISTPDAKQSKAYIATVALFMIFGSSTKEDKVFLRLPAVWRDLWTEMVESKKEKADEEDRAVIRTFRDMVRERRDQEEEDGVLIQGAFKNRGSARITENKDEVRLTKDSNPLFNAEAYQRIWSDKSGTPTYQRMLVSSHRHHDLIITKAQSAIAHATAYVGF
jgi:ATP-dependent RNA helicase DHX29